MKNEWDWDTFDTNIETPHDYINEEDLPRIYGDPKKNQEKNHENKTKTRSSIDDNRSNRRFNYRRLQAI